MFQYKNKENFDKTNSIPPQSGYHTVRSSEADITKLLKQVHNDSNIFSSTPGRKHRNFPKFESNALRHLSKPKCNGFKKDCNSS